MVMVTGVPGGGSGAREAGLLPLGKLTRLAFCGKASDLVQELVGPGKRRAEASELGGGLG